MTVLARKDDVPGAAEVRVSARMVAIFTRQLASMVASGVPLLVALEALTVQRELPLFGEVVATICDRLGAGDPLSRALSTFPRVFPGLYCTMVQVGEQTGGLHRSLDRLATWLERDDALRHRLKGALTYPAFLLGLLIVMTLGLSYTVMPGFTAIFQDMNIELPLLTRIVIALTDALRDPAIVIGGLGLLGCAGIALRRWLRTPDGFYTFYALCVRVPVLGGLLVLGSTARYCGAFEATLSSGLDIVRSLRLAAAVSGNPLIERDARRVIEAVKEGGEASVSLRQRADIYPATMVNLLASGEETSRIADILGRAAGFYEVELGYQIDAFSAAIEPVMLLLVSLVVGVVILAVFLPMYACLAKLGQ